MSTNKPTYRDLEKRLAEAEPIMEALRRHQVDAVIGEEKIAFLLLRGVEEALLESEAGFRAMFELPGIGMAQADTPALRFTRVNQKICDILGYSADELLTKTYIGLTHPLDRRRDMIALGRVLRGKSDSWSIEKRCFRRDGSVVRVGVDGAILRDDAGRAVRIMIMIGNRIAGQPARRTQRAKPLALPGKQERATMGAVEKSRSPPREGASDKPRRKVR